MAFAPCAQWLAASSTRHGNDGRRDPLDETVERQLASRSDETLRADLIGALESLPAHYLEDVLLRDCEELTIAGIAGRLGEQPGAVKSRLHRARELVREYLLGPGMVARKSAGLS